MMIATRLWISAAVVLFIGAASVSLVLWMRNEAENTRTGRHASAAISVASEAVLSDLKDAETGQRGFIITGDERYLQPFNRASADIDNRLAHLEFLTRSATDIHLLAMRLKATSNDKLKELRETIGLRREQGFDAAVRIVLTGRGKNSMDEVRDLTGGIKSAEAVLISAGQAKEDQLTIWYSQLILIGGCIAGSSLVLTTWLTVRRLRVSFGVLKEGIVRVGAGDVSADIDIHGRDELSHLGRSFNAMSIQLREERCGRAKAEQQLNLSNESLLARSVQLEQRDKTMTLLGQLTQRLPGCTGEREFVVVIEKFVAQLLPRVAGALYVISNSKVLLKKVAVWNEPISAEPEFTPDSCWALRRGQPHVLADRSLDIVCSHVSSDRVGAYRCLPLVAQGDSVGLLYIEGPNELMDIEDHDLDVLTEVIALSLVNLRLRESLRSQSIRDPLTGLFNRRYLEESLQLEFARSDRSGHPISVLMLDIDHFKEFNDSFGHEAGDGVLSQFAETLRRCVRKSDVACRYGGEEFAVVLPESAAPIAAAIAEKICIAVREMTLMYGGNLLGKVTVSIGVAQMTTGTEPSALLKAADQALYRAKGSGRDRVEIFLRGHRDDSPTFIGQVA